MYPQQPLLYPIDVLNIFPDIFIIPFFALFYNNFVNYIAFLFILSNLIYKPVYYRQKKGLKATKCVGFRPHGICTIFIGFFFLCISPKIYQFCFSCSIHEFLLLHQALLYVAPIPGVRHLQGMCPPALWHVQYSV